MSAGLQPSVTQINQTVGQMAVSLRTLMQQVVDFNDWLAAYGGSTALVTLGFTEADAAIIQSTVGNLATLSAIYNGSAAAAFNYEANTQALFGGF